jgi:hypothetical protein
MSHLEQAHALDKHIASHGPDSLGPLAGVPVAIKVRWTYLLVSGSGGGHLKLR